MSNHRTRHREKVRAHEQAQRAATAAQIGRAAKDMGIRDMSSFDAASYSTSRGWIPTTKLRSTEELSGRELQDIRAKSRWLYNNSGYARVINILANLIGYQTVQPATRDKEWNRLAKDSWRNRSKSPSTFDRAGKYNHATWQLQLSKSRLKDGDILTVLLEASSGAAQYLLYEADQITNPRALAAKDRSTLRDGVFLDKFGRHIAYRIADPDDDTKPAQNVNASDAIFYADFERPGQVRGYPALSHAINDLIDITEIDADTKLGIKRRQFVGLYRKRTQPGAPGQLYASVDATATGTTTTGIDGSTKNVMQNVEKAYDGTGIASLEQGEDFGVVESDQPGPNEAAFNDRLLHKIAIGLGLPSQVLYCIIGGNGPEIRFHMDLLRRWLEVEMLRQLTANQTCYFYWLVKEIARGALPYPDDDQFWRALYIPQADITIDRGKEGRLQLEQLRMGAETFAHVWESAGEDWESQFELQAEVIARATEIAAEKALKLSDLIPGWQEGQQLANNFRKDQQPAPMP